MINEKGYLTAFSIILSLIIISVTLYNIKLLNSERLFMEERLGWFQINNILQLARTDLYEHITSDGIVNGEKGIFTYKTGKVSYQITEYESNLFIIRMDADMNANGKGTSLMYYNELDQEVIQWVVL